MCTNNINGRRLYEVLPYQFASNDLAAEGGKMMIKKFRIAAVLLALGAGIGATQSMSAGHVEIPTVAPRAEDVGSIDGMINAWYDVITGPAGKPRQWARDKTLLYSRASIRQHMGRRQLRSNPHSGITRRTSMPSTLNS